VSPGQTLTGADATLPPTAVSMISRIPGVEQVAGVGALPELNLYRSPSINPLQTSGILVQAADPGALEATGVQLQSGTWLNPANDRYPVVVLGADTAQWFGVAQPGAQLCLNGNYVTVLGILKSVPLAPELDSSALVGVPYATQHYGYQGNRTTIYERSTDPTVLRVRDLLPATANLQAPSEVVVSRPSDALAAKDITDQALTSLLLVGSGAVVVGGIGVANTMLSRPWKADGDRRALRRVELADTWSSDGALSSEEACARKYGLGAAGSRL
jgi:putative ABC transport system permease protein